MRRLAIKLLFYLMVPLFIHNSVLSKEPDELPDNKESPSNNPDSQLLEKEYGVRYADACEGKSEF